VGSFSYFNPNINYNNKRQLTQSGVDLTQINQNIVPIDHDSYCIGLDGVGSDGNTNQWKCVYTVGVKTANIDVGTICASTAVCTDILCMGAESVSETDIAKINGITDGTVAGNNALVVDANKDIATLRNVSMDGTLTVCNTVLSSDSTGVLNIGTSGCATNGTLGVGIESLCDIPASPSSNQNLIWTGSAFAWCDAGVAINVCEINDPVSNTIVANVDTFKFDVNCGFELTDNGSGTVTVGSSGVSYKTLEVSGQSSLVATNNDTLEVVAGTGITIATNTGSSPKQLCITNGNAERSTIVTEAFTATASQTTFTPAQCYTTGHIDVFLNGIKLIEGASNDFVANNNTSVVLNSGANVSDVLETVSYATFDSASHYTCAQMQAFPNHILPSVDDTHCLGEAGKRWKDVFASSTTIGDLHMHNDNGHFTLDEQSEYIRVFNHTNGKFYKLLMEELNE